MNDASSNSSDSGVASDSVLERDVVEVKRWVKRGMMMVNCDHTYNQIVAQGKDPEEYGVMHPLYSRFEGKSRSDLIDQIVKLEQEVMAYARHGY
jgi:hypothetical protein